MSASETHDLIVRARPEGIEETTQQMDDLDQSFEGTSDQMEESAGLLSDFSERFKGAASVIIAGLGTLAAGLLTQVPVIGESVSGINAIIDSLVLRIDERLRPALNDFNLSLFELASAIADGEGEWSALNEVARNWQEIVATLPTPFGFFTSLSLAIANFLTDTISSLTGWRAQFLAGIEIWATETLAGIRTWIAQTRTGFEVFFQQVIASAKRWANEIVGIIEEAVNDAIRAIPGFIRADLGISQVNIGTPFKNIRSNQEIAAAGRRRLRGRRMGIEALQLERRGDIERQLAQTLQAIQNNEQTTTVTLDGRELARGTEPFFGEGAANAGANSRVR